MPELWEQESLQNWLKDRFSQFLHIDPVEIDIHTSYAEYGLSSLETLRISGQLERYLQVRLEPALVVHHQTIADIVSYLFENKEELLKTPYQPPVIELTKAQQRRQQKNNLATQYAQDFQTRYLKQTKEKLIKRFPQATLELGKDDTKK